MSISELTRIMADTELVGPLILSRAAKVKAKVETKAINGFGRSALKTQLIRGKTGPPAGFEPTAPGLGISRKR
jgi:hypothetical protein